MTATSQPRTQLLAATGAALSIGLVLAACSNGAGGGESVEISFLVDNQPHTISLAEDLAAAFSEENEDVTVTVDTRPGGGDGDNLVKTRLATGEMADVFIYNSGSLFQALTPDQVLVDQSDAPWIDDLDDDFVTTVSTDNGIYGNAWGATFGGGIIYNRPIYDELGLEIPQSWDDFMANNEEIAAAGYDPVIQTYGSTYTSQLFVLGDFANVAAQDPDWAEEYTANNRRYADEPAVHAFEHHQAVYDAGYFNENFASADDAAGSRMVAEGEGAHYPMLTNTVLTHTQQNSPDHVDDLGFFAIPAQDADHTQATIWQATGIYIPQSTEGDELEAARDFVAFITSERGCELQLEHLNPGGPFPGTCDLPDDVAPLLTDIEAYVEQGRTAPALEYLSPVKGPNLEHILVEVGSGIRDAQSAAERYDEDVINQARQLGLDGW
ncbi:ABC transporter substrate-binding protein [Bogoriella caseilytica]|uniref:Carbohydrate ABC transporter substrate-binding protein (CUT1 family) n=1 Tax=Bogoriella caseilytica TaxID=56055 RepID=A0A3N2BBC6_9MICO|nr:ABC transporter substrate-binding protein [Bogoriella caseilytica]ROR72563.1 carbohydrate ABC transporter substrate-binding protein (CUT1 family) [Bogoriella caseilytica]